MAAQGDRTFRTNMVDPQVLADMVSGKVEKMIRVTPFAKIDNTLEGRPGSTVTVPFYGHIGNAVVVAEGEEIPVAKLTTSTKSYQIHKVGKGITITDEAVLSGYGDPVGEGARQLAQSIAQKIDADAINALYEGDQHFLASEKLKYTSIVDSIDVFQEEFNAPKVMFINPAQVTTLRKDSNFISADKYGASNDVVMYGEIGMIANTRIVVSKRVEKNAAFYYPVSSTTANKLTIVASSASTGEVNLADVEAAAIGGYEPKVGDYVLQAAANTYYINPIVRFAGESETETGIPAITIYTKRDTFVEPEREASKKQTNYYADKHCIVALTNADAVVLLYAEV